MIPGIIMNDRAFTARSDRGMGSEPTYAGALSFMRRRYTRDLTGIDIAVSGVPLDLATTGRPGARFGPAGIRAASSNLAWGRPWPWKFDPFETLSVVDYGDCDFDHGSPMEIAAEIEAHADRILASGASMLTLGGDHFVAYPLLKSHHKVHGPLALVHFDAHQDTETEDEETINHGTMFHHAAREGLVDAEHSVQIGIRTYAGDADGFNILDTDWLERSGTAAAIAEIKRIVGLRKAYLTFDIDCLDPSCAPGTGTPVCGGLSTAQAQSIIRGLVDLDFVAMDVVEVAPPYDHAEITSLAAASLALDYLCLQAARRM
jgi:agmatinase